MVSQCDRVAVVIGIALCLCYVVQMTSSKMLEQDEFLIHMSAEIYNVIHKTGQLIVLNMILLFMRYHGYIFMHILIRKKHLYEYCGIALIGITLLY